MKFNIAIDGPAGSGKSTIAKKLSKKFDIMYINTGSMYRGVTLLALEKGIKSDNLEGLCEMLEGIEMHFQGDNLIINGKDVTSEITMPYISNNVSSYAAISEVREILVGFQKNMSNKYSVIMDGRDIGTVVLKDARYKFFLTANAQERAKRRFKELTLKGVEVEFNTILEDIKKRDYMDENREISPLKKAEDVIEIDTSLLDIDGVIEKIYSYINEVR